MKVEYLFGVVGERDSSHDADNQSRVCFEGLCKVNHGSKHIKKPLAFITTMMSCEGFLFFRWHYDDYFVSLAIISAANFLPSARSFWSGCPSALSASSTHALCSGFVDSASISFSLTLP